MPKIQETGSSWESTINLMANSESRRGWEQAYINAVLSLVGYSAQILVFAQLPSEYWTREATARILLLPV